MHAPATGRASVRFREFEVDLRACELCRNGRKIKLQEQPFQILAMLLERPGEVVTREEIQHRLWPADTFVDFEHSISTAMTKLREALGDSAEQPRFIETLPRHGYRFIAPVEKGAMRELPLPITGPRAIHEPPLRRHWVVAAAGGLVAAVLAVLLSLNVGTLRDRLLRGVGAVREPPLQIQSIAVLPLENLSSDPEQEYFADGMTDELITGLAKIGSLRVISRNSVMKYKGQRKPTPQIAKELNVDVVVEGTVLRSGNRVRISAQLIQANPEKHLWAESYERDMGDILSMQAAVTQAIAREIRVTLTPAEQARVNKTRPVDPEAYQLYLQGNFQILQESERAYRRAIEDFRQAITHDPSYAPAYAGLSIAYQEVGGWQSSLPFSTFHTQAREAALKALELDDNLADGHIALGTLEFYEWNWAGADRDLRRGMDLNPTGTYARILYAGYLAAMGRLEESIAVGRRTVEIDPLSPSAYNELGWALILAGRDSEALKQYKKGLELDPRFAHSYVLLAEYYAWRGMSDEVVTNIRNAETFMDETRPPTWLGFLAFYYARVGRREDALRILSELERRAKTGYVPAIALAHVHLGLGETEKALSLLEKAYEDHNVSLVWLKVHRRYDPLRSDPRFQNLLRPMNFPP
jgi:TolB-like protein/DNA-binding winged helix-turn-helix (wHTH) protein/Tfp pilus assembly protein PilF